MTETEWKDIFGDNLASYLKDRGWTQLKLSKYTGISTTVINDYINKRKAPSVFAIINMADALDIDIGEFIYSDETID